MSEVVLVIYFCVAGAVPRCQWEIVRRWDGSDLSACYLLVDWGYFSASDQSAFAGCLVRPKRGGIYHAGR